MISVGIGDSAYPDSLLRRMGDAAPDVLHFIGDPSLLGAPLTAAYCSERVPADLVLPALEWARAARLGGEPVVSGFHSAVEREWLRVLLRGDQPIVVCPAREIGRLRLPGSLRGAIDAGRLVVVSPFGPDVRRVSGGSAELRNRLVAAVAHRVFVVSASPAGRLHRLARELAARGQRLACFDHPANEDLLLLGAAAVPPNGYRTQPSSAALSSNATT